MRRLLFSLNTFLLVAVFSATAQENIHDNTVNKLMAEGDWIALREYLEKNGEETNDFYRLTASGMWKMNSNQSEAAAADFEKVLSQFGEYLDPMTWVTLKTMSAHSYLKLRWIDKFIQVCDDILAHAELPEDVKDSVREQKAEVMQADLPPLPSVGWTGEETVIEMDSLNIFQAESNGEIIHCFFDTGAQQNLIRSKELADRLGVRYFSTDTLAMNEYGEIYRGTLDSVRIGNLTVRDLTVAVALTGVSALIPDSIHQRAQQDVDTSLEVMNRMELILGIPVMAQLEEIRFDFADGKIYIPRVAVTPQENASYMSLDENILQTNPFVDGRRMRGWLDTGDYGVSLIAYSYLEKNPGYFEPDKYEKEEYGTMQVDGLRKYECYILPPKRIQWAGCDYSIEGIFMEADDFGTNRRAEITMGRDFFTPFDNLVMNFRDMWIRCY